MCQNNIFVVPNILDLYKLLVNLTHCRKYVALL